MKIAVIGSGIIGYIASSYLADQGHEVDCIAPKITRLNRATNKKIKISAKYKNPVSLKFKIPEFIEQKNISDEFYPKELKNFVGLELVDEIGLARFWGANLGLGGLNLDIEQLGLDEEEKKFIERKIPILDVYDFYEKNSLIQHKTNHFSNYSNQTDGIYSSKLAINADQCDLQNLPDDRSNPAIFGNNFKKPDSYTRIDSKVKRILFNETGENPILLLENNQQKEYEYIIVACGAIGSYRLILDSINKDNESHDFSRIKHHPLLTTICLAKKLKYPNNFISMSNFEALIKTNDGNIFLNFFPIIGAFKASYRHKNSLLWRFLKFSIFKIYKITNRFPDFPLFPGWWLHRLYVINIYYPSEFSSSFIGKENDKIKIIGGFRFDFEKTCFRRLYKVIRKTLKKHNINIILNSPIRVETGGDLHYSGTLNNYTDSNGKLKESYKLSKKIKIIDSSTATYIPVQNPTYYFILRAIKLIREFKK